MTDASTPIVSASGLSKSYGRHVALADVDVEIGPGVTGLLGPNGAGKSTFLLCVLGLLPDWTGTVRVLGLDAARDRREIRRRVGFMPESDAILPDMSGIRAVRFLGRLTGMPYTEALRRAHEVLFHVGLGEAVYRELREYSTGMRQRFKLAQALVHDPELLFLDEPLGGMDPAGRDELLDLVRTLASEHGKHVIWSSHILPEVEKVADSVVVLHQGRARGRFDLADLTGNAGEYRIEVEGDAEGLVTLLRSRHIEPQPVPAAAGEALPGRSRWNVVLPDGQAAGDLLRLGRQGGVRVRRVVPMIEDLDAVFHRLLGEDGAP